MLPSPPPLLGLGAIAFVVDCAPQIHAPATDHHDHLVQMPTTGRRASALAKIGGHQRPKLVHPASNRFAADLHAALRQQLPLQSAELLTLDKTIANLLRMWARP